MKLSAWFKLAIYDKENVQMQKVLEKKEAKKTQQLGSLPSMWHGGIPINRH